MSSQSLAFALLLTPFGMLCSVLFSLCMLSVSLVLFSWPGCLICFYISFHPAGLSPTNTLVLQTVSPPVKPCACQATNSACPLESFVIMVASILKFITILSLGTTTLSTPVNSKRHVTPVTNTRRDSSFDNFNGLSSLSNFDSFFGSSNFDGSSNKQILIQEKQVVCQQIDVKVIQQRLTVIREFIKR